MYKKHGCKQGEEMIGGVCVPIEARHLGRFMEGIEMIPVQSSAIAITDGYDPDIGAMVPVGILIRTYNHLDKRYGDKREQVDFQELIPDEEEEIFFNHDWVRKMQKKYGGNK